MGCLVAVDVLGGGGYAAGGLLWLIRCASLAMYIDYLNTLARAYFGENLGINALSVSTRKGKDT